MESTTLAGSSHTPKVRPHEGGVHSVSAYHDLEPSPLFALCTLMRPSAYALKSYTLDASDWRDSCDRTRCALSLTARILGRGLLRSGDLPAPETGDGATEGNMRGAESPAGRGSGVGDLISGGERGARGGVKSGFFCTGRSWDSTSWRGLRLEWDCFMASPTMGLATLAHPGLLLRRRGR